MARRKRSKARRAAPAAIVVRQSAPMARRRRASPRVIVGRVARRTRRAASAIPKRVVGDALGVIGGAAIGWLRSNDKIPDRIAGVDTPLVVGLAMGLTPLVLKGKVGQAIGDVGVGVGAVAAYRLSLGTKVYVKPTTSAGEDWEDDD